MKLYDFERSGNCYKIRLFLSLLDIPYERVPVDIDRGENKSPAFLKVNPRGQLPILETEDGCFWDSTAILVYLARRYGGESWLPTDRIGMASVMQWLALEQNEGRYGLARARAIALNNPTFFARSGNIDEARTLGRIALGVLESRLSSDQWLAISSPTIADIACFPYAAMAPQGGIGLAEYTNVVSWIARIRGMPGYTPLPGERKA
ncbi:MAG TPA: glutathione S-transferase family protein [Sulfuricaulis sp.]